MSKKQALLLIFSFTLFVFLLSACNMPSANAPTPVNPGLIHTIAAQTVEAQMTLDAALGNQSTPSADTQGTTAGQPQLTSTPTMTDTPVPTDTSPPSPTDTPVIPPTNTPIPCDSITWGKDVTIPDGTEMTPGEKFTKTWRLKNTGSCTWTSGYSLVFDSGDAMGAPAVLQLTSGTVTPGQEMDVSVELTAPETPGTYRGNFKLRNPEGMIFGLGSKSDPFYVKIVVPNISGLMFDFLARADEATWGSGDTTVNFNGPGDIHLTYGSLLVEADGYVITQSNIVIEGGSTTGVILVTHPKKVNDGYIVGRYPAYKIGAGDHIQGRLGFLAEGDGICGAGNAIFQIYYTKGDDLGTLIKLGEWNEKCDGTLRKINIDLDALKGETVRFYLVVLANGASTDDKAIWASLGVVR
jgi:hypothetical protein